MVTLRQSNCKKSKVTFTFQAFTSHVCHRTQVQIQHAHFKIPSFADFSIINHPVHIMTKDNRKSQSSFIPFCEFGGDMSVVGVKIDQFDDPVCNSFEARILNNQLCYEVDLNRFSNKSNIAKELELGFYFLMDYNEDRQVPTQSTLTGEEERSGIGANFLESDKNEHAFIYLDTIGKGQLDLLKMRPD